MIIVDSALRQRDADSNPIRVAMVGAGAMGRGIALQIATAVPGMELVAIANRHPENAERAYREAGAGEVQRVSDEEGLAAAMEQGIPAVTDDPALLCSAEGVDAILEVTGAVEFGVRVALDAIAHRKHVVTMNAEMQGTVGPILKAYADRAGVVLTDSDGDQPGVMMNLYRFVRGIGVRPVLLGNMKGLHDPYRNPTTQEDFARRHHLTPHMAASFADGTKMSFEMTLVANATGLRAGRRGLYGPSCASVNDAASLFPLDQMLETGIIDYIVGAQPAPGVFALGHHHDPEQRRWLQLYKLGDGPLYTFYTPYHLCHLEAPTTIARAVLFSDAAVAADAGHIVDVVATAKRDLHAGETIDGIGWYMTYGLCENAEVVADDALLPIGLAEGCRLLRNVPKDQVLTYADVDLPEGRVCDRLRAEQVSFFSRSVAHYPIGETSSL
jgi:predicted homoserine dehydrogenase-like protein